MADEVASNSLVLNYWTAEPNCFNNKGATVRLRLVAVNLLLNVSHTTLWLSVFYNAWGNRWQMSNPSMARETHIRRRKERGKRDGENWPSHVFTLTTFPVRYVNITIFQTQFVMLCCWGFRDNVVSLCKLNCSELVDSTLMMLNCIAHADDWSS